MQILTDRGSDLSEAQMEGLDIHFVPLRLTLDGKIYSSGDDISAAEFYEILEASDGFPTTLQPTVEEYAALFKQLAVKDPEILYIHLSSGVSNIGLHAQQALPLVPEARITLWDSKSLSCVQGWQVEAAARAVQAGCSFDEVLALLDTIRHECEGIYTTNTLKYMIHGGRISHLAGLLGSALGVHPIVGVEKVKGKVCSFGQELSDERALHKVAEIASQFFPAECTLRVQMLHGKNPSALETLQTLIAGRFDCRFTPPVRVAPILGAHTGSGAVGVALGPLEIFQSVPGIVYS